MNPPPRATTSGLPATIKISPTATASCSPSPQLFAMIAPIIPGILVEGILI